MTLHVIERLYLEHMALPLGQPDYIQHLPIMNSSRNKPNDSTRVHYFERIMLYRLLRIVYKPQTIGYSWHIIALWSFLECSIKHTVFMALWHGHIGRRWRHGKGITITTAIIIIIIIIIIILITSLVTIIGGRKATTTNWWQLQQQ